ILPISSHNKIDLLTANARTIKLDRIFKDKVKVYEQPKSINLAVPRVAHIKSEIKHKTRKTFKHVHHSDINTVSENKINSWNFISVDDFKIFLLELNHNNEVYNIVDIDSNMEVENPEKITKGIFCDYNPSLFTYGTNKGNIRLCDLRTSSDHVNFSTTFNDE